MNRFAHSLPGQPETQWEPLAPHLGGVAICAARLAEPFGASAMALAMGLLHDIGKCALPYQNYIRQPEGEAIRGPDHSTAGAKEAVRLFGNFLGCLMAFGIAGHHGGLMDGDALKRRLDKVVDDYSGWQDHAGALPAGDEVSAAMACYADNAFGKTFTIAFLVRMVFSCLVDADFLETERFYAEADGRKPPLRGGVLGVHHRDSVRAYMARHRRDDTMVNRLRSEILDHANARAVLPPGLFTLTVPTGGGKTLISLSFAVEHAIRHGLRRVVYVIPFTGMRIETIKRPYWAMQGEAHPRTGMRIETSVLALSVIAIGLIPARGCG